MTIAACYVSHEGVVFGADSSSTYFIPDCGYRHYTNAQKIFEIGEIGSTLALTSWGRGGLPERSFRQLGAELSDSLIARPPASVVECVNRWIAMTWPEWFRQLGNHGKRFTDLANVAHRSADENEELDLEQA